MVDAIIAAELAELRSREAKAGITPDPALDRFMEAMSLQARPLTALFCAVLWC
jgi:hypothetical protein